MGKHDGYRCIYSARIPFIRPRDQITIKLTPSNERQVISESGTLVFGRPRANRSRLTGLWTSILPPHYRLIDHICGTCFVPNPVTFMRVGGLGNVQVASFHRFDAVWTLQLLHPTTAPQIPVDEQNARACGQSFHIVRNKIKTRTPLTWVHHITPFTNSV